MADTRHLREQELFVAAMDLPVADRSAFVARSSGDDVALRDRVLALLGKATDDDTFLLAPLPVAAIADRSATAPLGLAAGDRIGPYELVRLLGEGGFGAVWEACQHEPVHRQVALKVLKLGMDTEQVVARFAQERQALACLDHPGIARVLDAGATASGRPFFVMELVDGRPLVDYCDERRLPIDARLQLFTQVCDAVQHAHGRGIIHRDLKPSNVLVVERDGLPHGKVIDFGIAKAVGRKLTERTLLTEATQVIGTLEYMSPEQAGGSADIDIRTDVWSLGVMLYELLTGRTPFAPMNAADDWRGELLRRLQETEPLRPSTELARSGDRLPVLAGQRRTTGHRLGAQVRGELDWIVMKALERDRARRYATAHELAADVRAHLAGEPIVAAPPGAGYRLRKFVRRNRVLVAATSAVVAALAIGLVAFAWQAGVAGVERDRAVVAVAQSQQVQRLVLDALGAADAVGGGEQGLLVVEAMARAEAMLDEGQLADQPEVELGLRTTIAGVQCNNGAAAAALPNAERALLLARQLLPGDDERMIVALHTMAQVLADLGRPSEAEPLRRDAAAMAIRLWPDGHPLVAQSLHQHAMILYAIGKPAEGEPLLQQSLQLARRLYPGDHWVLAGILNEVGHRHFDAGRAHLAEPWFDEAVAMARRLHAGDHPRTARFLANLALAKSEQGRSRDAEPLLAEALAITERVFPGDSPEVVMRRHQFGSVLTAVGRTADAKRCHEQALAMSRRLFPGAHPRTAMCLEALGNLAIAANDAAGGEAALAEALAMLQQLHPGDHPDVARLLGSVAGARVARGRTEGVEAQLLAALAMVQRLHPGDHREVQGRLRDLGFHYWSNGRHAEAEQRFAECLAMRRRLRPGDDLDLVDALDDLGSAQLGKGEHVVAANTFGEALAVARRVEARPSTRAVRVVLKGAPARFRAGEAESAAGLLAAVERVCAQP
ncbi:MAG: tetratricopeptide repeat protein, partial [Planctomycetes bacterium]|nr:tetratricopeptide repeat protein [Planctomycetota bacterium]